MNVFPVILFCIMLTTVIACGNSMPMASHWLLSRPRQVARNPQIQGTKMIPKNWRIKVDK